MPTLLHTHAPAKINLYLHVTGRREDGYHRLDSLVAFTNIGDEMRLESATDFAFALEGPMAAKLADELVDGNLAVRAARALAAACGRTLDVKLTLVKNLPVASGIGGGSTDAAAALRLLAQYWELDAEDARLFAIAATLGQDVPCCIRAETCYFRDIGDVTDAGPDLPHTDMVLVNPGKGLPTPAVFKARRGDFTPAARLERVPADAAELAAMLRSRSNGLTEAACELLPEIGAVLKALEQSPDCLLSRMSGSGATCFGLYPDRAAARGAAARIMAAHPDWWVVPAFVPARGGRQA